MYRILVYISSTKNFDPAGESLSEMVFVDDDDEDMSFSFFFVIKEEKKR